ncbi:MAG: hypothetical protein WC455_17975 [Dehalococcoidia bacterium]
MSDEKRLGLGIRDRLVIASLFPEKSNFVDQVLAEDIGKKVRINQEEMKEINLRSVDGENGRSSLTWDDTKAKDLDVEFTQAEVSFLKKQIDRLDRSEQLSPDIMPLAKAIKGL